MKGLGGLEKASVAMVGYHSGENMRCFQENGGTKVPGGGEYLGEEKKEDR